MIEIFSDWSWFEFAILLLTTLAISCFEVYLEYPKRFFIACKSNFFFQIILFNAAIAVILFILKASNRLDFITFSDSFLLIVFMGASGFLLFSSKIDATAIDASKDMLGFKSILSKLKSRIFLELKKYIEDDYPFEVGNRIINTFDTSKLDDYFEFVENCIQHFGDNNNVPYEDVINQSRTLRNESVRKTVFYLTNVLLDIKDPMWVEKNVEKEFCINQE